MFAAIANCFTRRAEALSAVLGAILTAPGPVDCVAHLSLTTPGYTHSGLYAALANGQIDPDAVAALAARVGNTDPLYVDVYSIDATSWLRPSAHTVDGLGRAFDAVGAKKGEPTQPGWSYQVIVRQCHAGGSWTLPYGAVRVSHDDDHSVVAATQIGQVARLHRGARPLFVADSGYSAHYLRWLLDQDEVGADLLIRLRSGRVFREAAPDTLHGKRHGPKFHLNAPPRPPDATVTFVSERYGQVTVDAYHGLHPELSNHHAGMTVIDGNPIFTTTLLHVSATGRLGQAGWWLWFDGEPEGADLEFLFWCYAHRFDIEHLFRFAKQTLGLTSARPGTAAGADVWVRIVLCAYLLLAACRRVLGAVRLPWEAARRWWLHTPGQVRRAASLSLARIVAGLGSGAVKNRPPGRARGAVTGPRRRHPVHVKRPKPG